MDGRPRHRGVVGDRSRDLWSLLAQPRARQLAREGVRELLGSTSHAAMRGDRGDGDRDHGFRADRSGRRGTQAGPARPARSVNTPSPLARAGRSAVTRLPARPLDLTTELGVGLRRRSGPRGADELRRSSVGATPPSPSSPFGRRGDPTRSPGALRAVVRGDQARHC
jgi:hypothetical protein